MKRWHLVLVVLAVLGVPVAWVIARPEMGDHDAAPQQEPPRLNRGIAKELGDLMRRKLDNAQKILEGIALSDFDQIAKHADELIAVSKQAEWAVLQTAQYEAYSNDLRRNAEVMIQRSKEKNLDGVVLAYLDLTMTCVKCHQHVREARQGP